MLATINNWFGFVICMIFITLPITIPIFIEIVKPRVSEETWEKISNFFLPLFLIGNLLPLIVTFLAMPIFLVYGCTRLINRESASYKKTYSYSKKEYTNSYKKSSTDSKRDYSYKNYSPKYAPANTTNDNALYNQVYPSTLQNIENNQDIDFFLNKKTDITSHLGKGKSNKNARIKNEPQKKKKFPEKHYQKIIAQWWINAKIEVIAPNKTRCDVLTDEYAIEVEFAPKWIESIGQSLNYASQFNKKAGIVLILESPKDYKYYNLAKKLITERNLPITIWYIENYLY